MPQISVSLTQSGQVLSYEIGSDLTIIDLKSFINAETGIPPELQILYLNGQPLMTDSQTLQAAGISDHDMLALQIREPSRQGPQPQSQASQQGSAAQPQPSPEELNASIEQFRQRLLRSSFNRDELASEAPDLVNAVNDPMRFREAYTAFNQVQREREAQRFARLTSDDVNEENQAEIEEHIRQENIERERQEAMQENPEFFVPVTMLYIELEVNGHPIKAFVDSGAQATIMSPACAETCNVTRLIDKRFASIAVGVGTAKILGKVHRAEVRIGDAELPCAFTVMEGKNIDMLLGLDMLKRYQASIDLHQNRLILYGGVSVPFLPESEIPKRFLDALDDEPVITGPEGTTIGAKSGAIKPTAGPASATISTSTSGPSSSNFAGAGRTLDIAPTASSPIPRPSAPTPSHAAPEFPIESIDALQRLGASRAQAIEALRASGGNVELAAGIIYDQF